MGVAVAVAVDAGVGVGVGMAAGDRGPNRTYVWPAGEPEMGSGAPTMMSATPSLLRSPMATPVPSSEEGRPVMTTSASVANYNVPADKGPNTT